MKTTESGVGESEQTDEISPLILKKRLESGEPLVLLDVREPYEFQIVHLDAQLIPLRELANRVKELDASKETVVYCHTGMRSLRAVEYLKSSGFKNVKNLTGGIEEWARTVDPTMTRY